MNHGTASGYVQGCRCDSCREANRKAVNAHRVKHRRKADAERVGQPKFPNHLNNLRHAMTLEDWQAREAADPACRPVTQAKMQLRAERMPTTGDGLTPFERIIAEGTL